MELSFLQTLAQRSKVLTIVEAYLDRLAASPHWSSRLEAVQQLHKEYLTPGRLFIDGDGCAHIAAGIQSSIDLEAVVRSLLPWRIGPIQIDGYKIDAEWVSPVKWNLIHPFLGTLRGLRLLDVGASSGYFSLRSVIEETEVTVAIDPNERCYLQLLFLENLLKSTRFHPLPLSLHEVAIFRDFFHVALCMGVLYHQKDPIQALRTLRNSVTSGGRVVIETLGVSGTEDDGLTITGRYAKMRNVSYIPSSAALKKWMLESGLREIEVHEFGPITLEEQRRTPFSPFESLVDFLDPDDRTKTIEGYPAPHRLIAIGLR